MLKSLRAFSRSYIYLGLLLLLPLGCTSGRKVPVSLLPSDPLPAFEVTGVAKDNARIEIVPIKGQPFAQAIRARTLRQPRQPYEVQLTAYTIAPLQEGDAVLATFWIRAVESRSETGEAFTTFTFERNGEPFTRSGQYDASAGPEWRRIDVPFVVKESYNAGKAMMNLRLGFLPQTVEIGGVSLHNYGQGVSLKDLPVTEPIYEAGAPDAVWRKEALARIEKIRKANVTIRVRDAAGRPLPEAQVTLTMRRHAFAFGSAVDAKTLLAQNTDGEQYRRIVEGYFNRVVFENDMKWWAWNDVERRASTLQALDWLRARDITVRGHTLVWPSFKKTVDTEELKDDPAALRRHVLNHIREEAGSLQGKVVEWDVVNEPYTNNDLIKILGEKAQVEWFKETRAVDRTAKLYINDFGILSGGGADRPHQNHYEKTIRFLLRQGAPLEGIGMQGHIGGKTLTPPHRLLQVLDRFGQFDLPIQVTEFDISTTDENLQAAYLRDFLTTVYSHKSVEGVILWGFWEGFHWKPDAALWRKDWTIKPAGQAWLDLVFREWWTKENGTTNAQGEYSARGFLGDYELVVAHGGKSKTVPLTLSKDKSVEVVLQ